MGKLTGYRCANCGNMLPASSVGIVTCDCCGSQYKIENEYVTPLRIETWHYNSQVIGGEVIIPREFLHGNIDPTELMEMSLNRMAKDMAEKLVPLMDITIDRDIMSLNYILHGRLRVAVPPASPTEVLRQADIVPADTVEARYFGR